MTPSSLTRRTLRWVATGCVAGAMLATPLATPLAAQVTLLAPRPVSQPRPFARLSASAQALRDSIVALATMQLGKPYRRGAESPDRGFDCSGLVKYVMARFGVLLPRTSHEQALAGKRIDRDIASLKPGDLLTFGRGKRVSHIGIYIGNGRYVHAPMPGARVRVAQLTENGHWWKGARRVLPVDDVASASDSLK